MVTHSSDSERREAAKRLGEQAVQPAVIGSVRFGTAGWADKSLTQSGLFYPRGARDARGRLQYYARHFGLVEVDATYYTLLPADATRRWADITPDAFHFDVKAYPVITGHPIDTSRLPKDLQEAIGQAGFDGRVEPRRLPRALVTELEDRFAAMLEPLSQAGKLRSVLVQMPPWFTATRGNARRLEQIAERWSQVPLSVEFRHASWLQPRRRQRVFDLLRRLNMSYVCVDEPATAIGGVPPVVAVTNPELAVVRLHGQNAAGWRRGASVHERFDYLYGPEELAAWVQPVQRLAREADTVHVIFNNCVRDHAVLGAKGLAVLLAEADTAGAEP